MDDHDALCDKELEAAKLSPELRRLAAILVNHIRDIKRGHRHSIAEVEKTKKLLNQHDKIEVEWRRAHDEHIAPIIEWVKPKIDKEKLWKERREGLLRHVLGWLAVILSSAVGLFLLNALREFLIRWLQK